MELASLVVPRVAQLILLFFLFAINKGTHLQVSGSRPQTSLVQDAAVGRKFSEFGRQLSSVRRQH